MSIKKYFRSLISLAVIGFAALTFVNIGWGGPGTTGPLCYINVLDNWCGPTVSDTTRECTDNQGFKINCGDFILHDNKIKDIKPAAPGQSGNQVDASPTTTMVFARIDVWQCIVGTPPCLHVGIRDIPCFGRKADGLECSGVAQ